MKKTAVATALLLAAPVLSVMTVETAHAASKAPSCVKVKTYKTGGMPSVWRAEVTNNCSKTMKLKVVWNNARDSSCRTVKKGQTFISGPGHIFGTYDKTVTC